MEVPCLNFLVDCQVSRPKGCCKFTYLLSLKTNLNLSLMHFAQSASEDICAALRRALLHLDPEGSTFTLTQLQFVRLCVQRRAHHEALPVLANSIYRFPSRTSKVSNYPLKSVPACPSSNWITPTSGFTDTIRLVDIQQYYQLGAIAYLRSGDLPNASLYLEHVLATPAYNVPNAPMIEAYQTWLLVSLVLHGPSVGFSYPSQD